MISQSTSAPAAQIQQALTAFKARDRDAAAAVLAGLVTQNPPLGSTWGAVSRLAMTLGETSLAVTAASRHADLDKRDVSARLAHGQMLIQSGRSVEALRVAEHAASDQPSVATLHFLGSCRAALGAPNAVEAFRRGIALSVDPQATTASWLAIAEARTFTAFDDPDIIAMERLRAAWPQGQGHPEARAALLYALAKAYDDLECHDAAFDLYAEGGRLVADVRANSCAQSGRFVDGVVAGFTQSLLATLPRGVESRRPIFVLGLPRSGTTLVEQILTSHSQVVDGAELNFFQAAAMPIGAFDPTAVAAFAASRPDGFARIGQAYLHMLDERFGPDGHVVDKTLNHSRFLGLIHKVLPNARFIWLRRDPAAVAWSNYTTWFAQGMEWSWSLEAIARHMRSEDRLHAHWTRTLGGAVLTVPYEALVVDPSAWIARILEHVGLAFEPGVEQFHQTNRAVTTASFDQVRKPIYTSSVAAWRSYETRMSDFFAAYHAT